MAHPGISLPSGGVSHPRDTAEHQAWVDGKRAGRMAIVDGLPAEVRALVHDYGLNTVKAFLDHGVTRPRSIRHLVETVLDEFSPTRGSFSSQGRRTDPLCRMDEAK